MKSILIGNGLNIQFGKNAYSNDFIMKRIKYRINAGYYSALFNNTITSSQLLGVFDGFVEMANDITDNKYDVYVDNEETQEALEDFKRRYKVKIIDIHEIMLEDWFFLLHIFYLKNSDIANITSTSKQGFEKLILDAIYNNGNIQDIHNNMNKKVKRYFSSFDNIFSLNYDNNIESLTGKIVSHLHGDFSVLANSENIDNVLGFIRAAKNTRVIVDGMEHSFCNALLNYSGKLKMSMADANHNLILEAEKIIHMFKTDEAYKSQLLNASAENSIGYEMILTKINHPELNMATEYYFDNFRNIEDELHIVGMSPNNDSHIFECINNNDKLKKVYLYCYSDKEREYIDKNFPDKLYESRSVSDLWRGLEANHPKFNCNYTIPDKIDLFISCFNAFSGDIVLKEQIVKEVNTIPQYEMDRLCILVKKDMIRTNPRNKIIKEEDLKKSFASISYIALQEGILPSTLYMIVTMNFKKLKDV